MILHIGVGPLEISSLYISMSIGVVLVHIWATVLLIMSIAPLPFLGGNLTADFFIAIMIFLLPLR